MNLFNNSAGESIPSFQPPKVDHILAADRFAATKNLFLSDLFWNPSPLTLAI